MSSPASPTPTTKRAIRSDSFAALLSHQPMGYYPPSTLVVEARRRGVAIPRPALTPGMKSDPPAGAGRRVGS